MKHKKKLNITYTFLGITIAALAIVIGLSAMTGPTTKTQTTTTASLDAAPVFSKTTINGNTFSLQESIEDNKPTVVYFMASSCTKCAKNWAAMNEVYPNYEDKINLIAISVDPTDDEAVLSQLAQDKGFVFDTIAGDPALAAKYEVFKQTAKFGIDKNGNIIERHDGVYTPEEWVSFFERLL